MRTERVRHCTTNPLGKSASSAPVVTMSDVGFAAMLLLTVSCTVRLVGLTTVTFEALIPGAAVTIVLPCANSALQG